MKLDQTNRQPARILPALIIAAVAITAGIWAAKALLLSTAQVDPLAATRFPAARPMQPFHLQDQDGKPFDNESLTGSWSFLFFGYTHCPDVCPTTLSVLNSVAGKVADVQTPVHFVFITVDPERDTPEQLAGFVRYFNKGFIGATGTVSQIEQLTGQLGVLHARIENPSDKANYLVDHSAGVFLIDPNGDYHAVFTPPLTADAISSDFHQMVRDFH
jgi:protein SCO1/2